MTERRLSVIIPARDDEPALPALLACLEADPRIHQILVMREGSRARSLNRGAERASGDLLWFLHADSRIDDQTIDAVFAAARRAPEALLYFDLAFANDAGPLIRLNQWGANLRCRLLRLPFGDQGLACTRSVYERVGPYSEDAPYGEDHLFVWQAHHGGVPVVPVGAPLFTSARTYAAHGWLKLTLLYQIRFLKQALPQAWKAITARRP